MNWESVDPFVLSGGSAQQINLPNTPSSTWARWDWYIKKATTTNSSDGIMQLWINNELVYDRNDFDSDGADLAKNVNIGNYLASTETGSYVNMDDIFVNYTRARVEICNNPLFSASTHCEVQVPVAWSNSSITIIVNQGTLSPSSMNLYVIDSNGTYNNAGKDLSGTVDISPPASPTGLTVR